MNRLAFNIVDEVERLQRELDAILGGRGPTVQELEFSPISFLPGRAARGYPLVNVSEDSEKVVVEALAPGLDPKNITVSLTGTQLTLSGEKPAEGSEVHPEAWHRNERAAGTFTRGITLPSEVVEDKITAEYEQGILKVTLPKSEAARPKTIPVKVL